jgi:hypothetical protein
MRDGVWSRGDNTELEVWIAGQARSVVVTSEAIAHYLALTPEEAAAMDAEERRRFVRDNISLVAASANSKVKREDGAPASITIHSGELHEQSR